MAVSIVILVLGFFIDFAISTKCATGNYTIRVLHHNDFHSQFDGASYNGMECKNVSSSECYGRISRWKNVTDSILKDSNNTIFLYGGDMFQGSLYFVKYGASVVSNLTRNINYTAFSFGNHEFDNGVKQLVSFIKSVSFPVICCNLDASKEPELQKVVNKSIIRVVNGKRVGIIGFLTPETVDLSSVGNAKFTDEVKAIREEAQKLKRNNTVDLVFAVGHSGIDTDKRIATEVEEIDLVVGGHTNTFLYNGESPFKHLKPSGKYPIMVKQKSGKVVPVVQAYAFGVLLGDINLVFNCSNQLIEAYGEPILMNTSYGLDETLQKDVDAFTADLEQFKKKVIGYTTIKLQASDKYCRLRECTMGNFIADRLEQYAIDSLGLYYKIGIQWTGFPIAMINAGGLKTDIGPGNVTVADVLKAFPYPNNIALMNVTGEVLLKALQKAVSSIIAHDPDGRFLQFSGLNVVYNLSRTQGDRLVDVKVRCRDCLIPTYSPVILNNTYMIITGDYVASGSDGFSMFKNSSYIDTGLRIVDLLLSSFEKSPYLVEINRRITIQGLNNSANEKQFSGHFATQLLT